MRVCGSCVASSGRSDVPPHGMEGVGELGECEAVVWRGACGQCVGGVHLCGLQLTAERRAQLEVDPHLLARIELETRILNKMGAFN